MRKSSHFYPGARLACAMVLSLVGMTAQPVAAQPAAPSYETAPVDHAPVVTRHRGVFNGQKIAYTATVEGRTVISGPGQSTARIVSFAYTRDGADPATRPVMFLFNGGPIAASPFVHIGGLGPKRVAFPDDVNAPPERFRLVDNVWSPLDAVDLVFVDPASTGFSRVTGETRPEDYFSVPADAAQLSAFVRAWLADHGRSGAPVYLFGESYGTNRAAAMAGQLAQGPDPLPLAGVFLYGQAVNIIEYVQRPNNVASYVASLPTIAMIGWYHGRVDRRGRSFDQFVAEARAFAKGDYLTALYQGDALAPAEQARLAARLAEFSGIPAEWYLANRLRISKERYRVELLKDRELLLGRSDARYVQPITDQGGAPDPSDVLPEAIQRFWGEYLRNHLKVDWTEPYAFFAPVPGLEAWDWGYGTSPFGDWPYYEGISRMMALNPQARVVVANGYYDTQTTMGAAELLVTQAGWDRNRTTLRYYDGGHMGYSVEATARAIGEDIRNLVRQP